MDKEALKAATDALVPYGLHRDWAKRYATKAVETYLFSAPTSSEPLKKAEGEAGELVELLQEVAECFRDAPDTTYCPRILAAAALIEAQAAEIARLKGEGETI